MSGVLLLSAAGEATLYGRRCASREHPPYRPDLSCHCRLPLYLKEMVSRVSRFLGWHEGIVSVRAGSPRLSARWIGLDLRTGYVAGRAPSSFGIPGVESRDARGDGLQ